MPAPPPAPAPAPLPVFHPVDRYQKIGRIGEGTYGVVYKARDRETGSLVALKRVRLGADAPGGGGGGNAGNAAASTAPFGRDGMPLTTIRELACLQAGARSGGRDAHLVALLAVATAPEPDAVFLVFEFCPFELGAVLDAARPPSPRPGPHTHHHDHHHHHHHHSHPARGPFSVAEVKALAAALLAALEGLHRRFVVHRDVKPSNLLLTAEGVLKLCDCGLARPLPAEEGLVAPPPAEEGGESEGCAPPLLRPPPLTARVVTLWYRAPELLWGAPTYGAPIDVWAAGCVVGELLSGRPLFPERAEAGVVAAHARLLGSPTPRIWPALAALPAYTRPGSPARAAAGAHPYNFLGSTIGGPAGLSPSGRDLLNGLLTYDPGARLTARAALAHAWFGEAPPPAPWAAVASAAAAAVGVRSRGG